jgi:hypothetical protein
MKYTEYEYKELLKNLQRRVWEFDWDNSARRHVEYSADGNTCFFSKYCTPTQIKTALRVTGYDVEICALLKQGKTLRGRVMKAVNDGHLFMVGDRVYCAKQGLGLKEMREEDVYYVPTTSGMSRRAKLADFNDVASVLMERGLVPIVGNQCCFIVISKPSNMGTTCAVEIARRIQWI